MRRAPPYLELPLTLARGASSLARPGRWASALRSSVRGIALRLRLRILSNYNAFFLIIIFFLISDGCGIWPKAGTSQIPNAGLGPSWTLAQAGPRGGSEVFW